MKTRFGSLLLVVVTIFGLVFFLVQPLIGDYSDQEFLSGFHTGIGCLKDAYDPNATSYSEWTPARLASVLKVGLVDERAGTIHEDGSVTDGWTDELIRSNIEEYLGMEIVPIIEFNRIHNFETLSETAVENFLTRMAGWMDVADPESFVIWNPAAEFNFPDGMKGWENGSLKIDYRDFIPQIKMIRRVRDALGLQDKVLIGVHANLLIHFQTVDGKWHIQDWETGFVGVDEYLEGFAQADIFGVSHYLGYRDPEYNPHGLTWQETLQKSWLRSEIIWQKICQKANRILPFYFMEYCVGNVWREYGDPLWKEAVTHTYKLMVHNNEWVKGINWYTGPYVEEDAMQELVYLAGQYDGYVGILGDINGDGVIDIFDVVVMASAFGSRPGDPNWNPDADLNNDGVVDVFDIVKVAKDFGKE